MIIKNTSYGLLLALLLMSRSALGAWDFVPDLSLEVQADDNPRLGRDSTVEQDSDTASSMLLDARFTTSTFNERGSFVLQPRLRADTYADSTDSELESEDLFLSANGQYRWQRTTAGFRGYISRESILRSELLDAAPIDPDIEDPVPIDTGELVELDEHRTRSILAPSVDIRLSERSALLLEARHLDVSYSGPQIESRTGFRDMMVSAGIGRNIDDRNNASARLTFSDFQADANDNDTDTVGVEGRFSRALSDIWTFSLSTGLQRSEFAFIDEAAVQAGTPAAEATIEGVDTDVTVGLRFRKRTELSTLNLDIGRRVDPNSSGFLQRRNEFRVALRRQMSARLTGGFAFRAFDARTFGIDNASVDREYARLEVDLEWALRNPLWSIGFGFDSTFQDRPSLQGDATSNALYVGVNYRGLSRRDAAAR